MGVVPDHSNCTEWAVLMGPCECVFAQTLTRKDSSPDATPFPQPTPPCVYLLSTWHSGHHRMWQELSGLPFCICMHTGSNQIWRQSKSRNEAIWSAHSTPVCTIPIHFFIINLPDFSNTLGLVMLILRCTKPSCFVAWRTDTVNSPYFCTPLVSSAGQYW